MPGGGAGGGARLAQAEAGQDRLEGEAAQYCPERYVLVLCVIDSIYCVNNGRVLACCVVHHTEQESRVREFKEHSGVQGSGRGKGRGELLAVKCRSLHPTHTRSSLSSCRSSHR